MMLLNNFYEKNSSPMIGIEQVQQTLNLPDIETQNYR